jgi:hypothetical protein
MYLLMKRNELFAFVVIFMCKDQFRSLPIVTPRYLAVSVVLSSLLWSVYGKMSGFLF